MYVFLDENEKLLEKYNEILDKSSNTIKKEFHSEPVCNKKYLKVKIKSHEGKIITNFLGDNIPKKCFQCISLSVILIDSVF